MPLISSATRFFANGQAGLAAACARSALTRSADDTSTTMPATSLRAANAVSLSRSVAPEAPGSTASSATFDASVTITVFSPDAGCGGCVVIAVSVTPVQVVAPLVTASVNGT